MKNKRTFAIILICLAVLATLLSASPSQPRKKNIPIRVAVFDRNGSSPFCITDAIEALKIDPEIIPSLISASDIMLGKADQFDALLFPGGSGRSETGSLGELGQQKVIDYVKQKGNVVIGICAGAYILTETPAYPSLALSGAEAIDIEHDHRGHGIVKFSLSDKGKRIFPELSSYPVLYSQYYEGPVLIRAKKSKFRYIELATMLSDVHTVKGAPANMTNNRPFILMTEIGKGRTASFVGHPEATPGMRWMVPRMVRYLLGRELIHYSKQLVRPDLYKREILFTDALLKKQRNARLNLLKSKQEKLEAMQTLVQISAWSAKKWIPPMVRSRDPEVRLAAARWTLHLERTDAIRDLEAAVQSETNAAIKKKLDAILKDLINIYEGINRKK